MRKKIISLGVLCLVVSICISSVPTSFAADSKTVVVNGVALPYSDSAPAIIVKDDVELIYVPPDNNITERNSSTIDRSSSSIYSYLCDGDREYNSAGTQQRVWGWSTCSDDRGFDVYHYTTSQFETIFAVVVQSSGRIYGYGKVWAYSPWVGGLIGLDYFARVYYGM